MENEYIIVAAALKSLNLFNGVIISLPRPARHHHIIRQLLDDLKLDSLNFEQGFLTSDGKFIDRYEAYLIAKEAGQMLDGKDFEGKNTLYSEDLW